MIELLQIAVNGILDFLRSSFLELSLLTNIFENATLTVQTLQSAINYFPPIIAGAAGLIIVIKIAFLILGR